MKENQERKISLDGQFATDWIRFKEYKYVEDDMGVLYILPASGERLELYDPFKVAESLLIDTLKLGDDHINYKKLLKEVDESPYKKRKAKAAWEEIKKSLLAYVTSYGLMGFASSSTYNRNVVGDKDVLIMEHNSIDLKERIMSSEAYMAIFTPFVEEGVLSVDMYKGVGYLVKYEDTPRFYGKRPMILDLIFSSFYAEKAEWILNYASMLAKHYNQLQTYKTSARGLTEAVTIMANTFEASKISFTIKQMDQTLIAWEFDSLKTAIQTIYGFAVTDKRITLNRCEHCNDFYIAMTKREKYCGPACRNRSNVMKSRARAKEKE